MTNSRNSWTGRTAMVTGGGGILRRAIVNLGIGSEITIRELVELMVDVNGARVRSGGIPPSPTASRVGRST